MVAAAPRRKAMYENDQSDSVAHLQLKRLRSAL
jgi:hypothetical protein